MHRIIPGTNVSIDSIPGRISRGFVQTRSEVTLSHSQILTLNTSPVQVTAAPGLNRIVIPLVSLQLYNITSIYNGVAGLFLEYDNGVTIQNLTGIGFNFTGIYSQIVPLLGAGDQVDFANLGLRIKMPTANPTDGHINNTLRFIVSSITIDL